MPNLFLGDCLDVLKTLPENSIDSLVTDPPYFLTGSSGSGFMGKSWDSLSLDNAIVESYFKLMKIVLDMDEASTVLERVNTLKSESPATSAKNQSNQLPLDFVPELVLTKQEVLVLCREMLPSHTTAVEKLPNHALFVGQPFNIKTNTPRSIVRIIVGILQEEPEWLDLTTIFTSTEKTESAKNSTEEKSGTSLESQSTLETDTVAESVEQSAQNTTSNATTLSPIEFQTTIQKIISLPCVKAVIKQCTSSQNLIPLLSEAFHYNWAKEVLRVLKPGAHGLVFGGTRTYHRLVSSLEDAGFEIRDCVMWLHGQGFPKSLSVSKQLEKQGYPEEAEKWAGFGTALKPAYEPIVLIRRPLSEKTVASNVLKHGTGGLNIDESRIGTGEDRTQGGLNSLKFNNKTGTMNIRVNQAERPTGGRFPSHLVLDEEAASLLDEQSGFSKSSDKPRNNAARENILKGKEYQRIGTSVHSDSGGASRFFYCPKASRADKNFGLDGIEIIEIALDTWENADQKVQLQVDTAPSDPKVIGASGAQLLSVSEWNTLLFGNSTTDLFLRECKSTTSTTIPSTIESKTYKWLLHSNTSEYIADVSYEMESGGSRAILVVNLNLSKLLTTNDETDSVTSAKYAQLKESLKIKSLGTLKSTHPTVKSTKLMEYLIKLITPPNGVVLDCFMGSGSTGVAALRAGFQFIGIEKEPEYFEIAEKRLSAI